MNSLFTTCSMARRKKMQLPSGKKARPKKHAMKRAAKCCHSAALFFYGRPGRFRTADLYRVKVALSP
jgi:hypothetical protein